ncbi:MAG TPA: hypothetical protein VG370_20935 [Chloroflexota bacterium]|nr:hypothetical protein [Chloroflexota bacterium]
MTSHELDARFMRRVLARLPEADRHRRRRRVVAALSRPAVAVLVALLAGLVGASALPAYGAPSTRVAVRAVSWLMVGQSIATNLSAQLLGDLQLQWLPVATAVLLLATIAYGADRRMRRVRQPAPERGEGPAPERSEATGRPMTTDRSALPSIDGRNLLVALLALVVLGAALVPVMALGRGTVHVGPLHVQPGETLGRTLLVVAGDAVVAGRSTQPLIVLGGDVRIETRADDDVVAIGGNVLLGETSVAARDVVAIGGRVLRADGATVLGNVAGQELRWTGSTIHSEQDLWSAFVVRFRLALLGAAAGLLLAIAAVTLVPWMVVLTAATGRGAPLQSGLIGLTGLACAPLLIVPLALSLVGAPLAGLLGIGLALCWWIGAASFGFLVGRRLLRLLGRDGSLTRAALVGGALLGSFVGLPLIGGVAIVLAGAVGAGAVLLALIEGEFGSARAPETTIGMVAYE